jgi:hypothetical protein
VPLSPEQRRARAQLAARKRWHGDNAETTPEIDQLEQATLDRHVNVLVESWHRATPEQKARLRRLVAPLVKAGGSG